LLGAVFAFTGLHGLDDELFTFVVAHGCVEISVMCLSGAAGAAVGEALIRPGAATRTESFQRAALQSGKYGKLLVSKGYCCKPRWSIGTKETGKPPAAKAVARISSARRRVSSSRRVATMPTSAAPRPAPCRRSPPALRRRGY